MLEGDTVTLVKDYPKSAVKKRTDVPTRVISKQAPAARPMKRSHACADMLTRMHANFRNESPEVALARGILELFLSLISLGRFFLSFSARMWRLFHRFHRRWAQREATEKEFVKARF